MEYNEIRYAISSVLNLGNISVHFLLHEWTVSTASARQSIVVLHMVKLCGLVLIHKPTGFCRVLLSDVNTDTRRIRLNLRAHFVSVK